MQGIIPKGLSINSLKKILVYWRIVPIDTTDVRKLRKQIEKNLLAEEVEKALRATNVDRMAVTSTNIYKGDLQILQEIRKALKKRNTQETISHILNHSKFRNIN